MNRRRFFIFVLILLVGGVVAYALQRRTQDISTEKYPGTIHALSQSGKISIPSIASYRGLTPAEVPEELSLFVLSGYKSFNARAVVFADGTSGYVLVTQAPNRASVSEVYNNQIKLFREQKWTIISGNRSDNASLLEAQNDDFQVKVILIPLDGWVVQATAMIIQKP